MDDKRHTNEVASTVIHHESYTIKEYQENAATCPFPLDSPIVVILMMLKWFLWATYLTFQYSALAAFGVSAELGICISWLVFSVEVLALIPPFLSQLDTSLYLFSPRKQWRRSRKELLGDAVPLIDVFITCCGEDVDSIMDTVLAAAAQDYPREKYRVFVLDDARSSPLKSAVTAYNRNQPGKIAGEVVYLSRTKSAGQPHYFKAGNLQYGIQESKKWLPESQYFAALDADAISKPDWLRRLVPHMILDERLAVINPGQLHYNLPVPDILGQDSAATDNWLDNIRDNIGASGCYGSGYLMRRSALEDIGGWPKVAVGEDILCGFTLAGRGWKTGFCGEILQYDQTPDSMEALLKQRMRWMDGDLNLVKAFSLFLPGLDPCSQRTVIQRISAIVNSIRLYRAITDTLFPMLLVVIVPFLPAINVADQQMQSSTVALKSLYLMAILVDKLGTYSLFGGISGLTNSDLWISPCMHETAIPSMTSRNALAYVETDKALRVLNFFSSSNPLTFQATGTVLSHANERSAKYRIPVVDRLKTPQTMAYLSYTVLATASLSLCIRNIPLSTRHVGSSPTPVHLAGAMVWLLECIFKMSIPWRYMIWPPTMPERHTLLSRNEHGVAEPKQGMVRSSAGKLNIPWLDVLQVGLIVLVDWAVL